MKGLIFTAPRDTISFFVGIIVAIFGVIPLLNGFGVISFLPGLFSNLPVTILVWIVALAGLYVVIDGFIEPKQHSLHWFLVAAGLIMLIVGLLPILNTFGIISFSIPFLSNLVVYYILITIEGLFLIIGGLTEH